MRRMDRSRVILFASVVAAAMVTGGVVGAVFSAGATPLAALAASSPSPTFHSNESATHESGESAAQEQAENNGTFHPRGPGAWGGGHPCGGHSNEDATHEKNESASVEAAENAACPPATASPTATK